MNATHGTLGARQRAYEAIQNAARIAQDYVREEFLLAPGKSFDVKMFPGGGFAARITKR